MLVQIIRAGKLFQKIPELSYIGIRQVQGTLRIVHGLTSAKPLPTGIFRDVRNPGRAPSFFQHALKQHQDPQNKKWPLKNDPSKMTLQNTNVQHPKWPKMKFEVSNDYPFGTSELHFLQPYPFWTLDFEGFPRLKMKCAWNPRHFHPALRFSVFIGQVHQKDPLFPYAKIILPRELTGFFQLDQQVIFCSPSMCILLL